MSNPGDEKDPEATNPNLARYLRADGWLDRHLAPLVASPLTLAALIVWTVACVAFGFWLAK